MNCGRFETWLDTGRPAGADDAARRHAAECPACGDALEASVELDRLFEDPGLAVSGTFADRVMARVMLEPRAAARPALRAETPWWIETWAEPTAALALTALALLAWQWAAVLSGIADSVNAAGWVAGLAADLAARPFATITGALPVAMLTLVFGALLGWGSLALYRGVEEWMSGNPGGVVPIPAGAPSPLVRRESGARSAPRRPR